jgi:superfamily I DNA/RNA helicase
VKVGFFNRYNPLEQAREVEVRLSTFHSTRGIEGQRVIIFGIEQVLDIAQKVNAEPRNLGYIDSSKRLADLPGNGSDDEVGVGELSNRISGFRDF